MQVFTARTTEMDDIDWLCEELGRQIAENVTFGERTIGIAVCDSTIDYQSVMTRLSQMYSFDIYGCTALSFIRLGCDDDISVSFMLITGNEELVGSMALSEPLTSENKEQAITDTYKVARERLGEDPKVIISLQPFSLEITPDLVTETIDRVSGCVPLYGAVSSNDLETNVSGVFVNGEFYPDRILLNLLGGGVRPLFAYATAKLDIPVRRAVITKAEGNVVYKVGEDTFLEFMGKNGLITTPDNVLMSFIATYTSSPVLIYEPGRFEQTQKVRNIIDINYENGAVSFTGDMPEGYELAIGVLRRDQVIASSLACLEDLVAKIEKNSVDGYPYSTLFSTSCGGRYLIMSGDTSIEGNFITTTPALKDLATCGFYAMGEICPISVDENGKAVNRALHSSITFMAL